jgi:hypothetical protein
MWEDLFVFPADPVIQLVQTLITADVRIDLLKGVWASVNYVLSSLYALVFIYAGFKFITSGEDMVKRENAKELLKNVFLLVICVQASFFIYDLLIGLGSGLAKGVFEMVNPSFLSTGVTLDYLVLAMPYYGSLLLTSLLLIIRYIIVFVGVVLFPIGIFLYFFDPLKNYGKLILNFLLTNIFIGFFVSLVILGFSKVSTLSMFDDFKCLLLTACFLSASLIIVMACFFAIIKSAFWTSVSVFKTKEMIKRMTKKERQM